MANLALGWKSFRQGLGLAWRCWSVTLLLWAGSLLAALCLAFLPALQLLEPAHLSSIAQAADGLDAWMVLEAFINGSGAGATLQGTQPQVSTGFQTGMLLGMVTLVFLSLFAWIVPAFLNGGVLLVLVEALAPEAAPGPFRLRRFFWGCWHWFAPFLLLDALFTLVWLLALLPLVIGFGMAMARLGAWGSLLLPLPGLILLFWVALVELTHVCAVQEMRRNIFYALGQALHLIWRRPLAIFALYFLSLLLLLALHLVFRSLLLPRLPLAFWPLTLVVQQAFIVLRLGVKAARLGGLAGVRLEAQSSRFLSESMI